MAKLTASDEKQLNGIIEDIGREIRDFIEEVAQAAYDEGEANAETDDRYDEGYDDGYEACKEEREK